MFPHPHTSGTNNIRHAIDARKIQIKFIKEEI